MKHYMYFQSDIIILSYLYQHRIYFCWNSLFSWFGLYSYNSWGIRLSI